MKISIITCVDGSVDAVCRTIASVEAQSHEDLEHILVVPARDAGTEAAIDALHHPDMIVLREYGADTATALAAGLRAATGSVVAVLSCGAELPGARCLSRIEDAFLSSDMPQVFVKLDSGPGFWRRNSFQTHLSGRLHGRGNSAA